jgi:hypothetical protein
MDARIPLILLAFFRYDEPTARKKCSQESIYFLSVGKSRAQCWDSDWVDE